MVKGKGRDEIAEGAVYRSLGDATEGGIEGRESVITSNTEGAR